MVSVPTAACWARAALGLTLVACLQCGRGSTPRPTGGPDASTDAPADAATEPAEASVEAPADAIDDLPARAEAGPEAGKTCAGASDCDDGDPCTVDSCDPALGCRHVDRSRCTAANCSLGACAGADTDGDGFSDAVEDADYIDLDCNGADDPTDFHFPHRAPYLFGAVDHIGTGTGVVVPTITDPTATTARLSGTSVLVTITQDGAVGTAQFTYVVGLDAAVGPIEARPVVDVGANLRLQFYGGGFVAGDTYTFTASTGPSVKIADKNVPNVYVHYDFMGDADPGAPCIYDNDCDAAGAQLNTVCRSAACTHDHAPGDPLLRMVVDAFAAHGVILYIDPVRYAVPHAPVVTFARASDADNGPRAICAGADVVPGVLTGGAVSFFDIKNRQSYGGPFDPERWSVFRYALFAHASTCLTDDPTATVGLCAQCPADRGTPAGMPAAGATGTSELPGNDLIISLGPTFNAPTSSPPRNPFTEQGVFMHELGHTLGLAHAGDAPTPINAPNYLSVMNPRYTFSGIQSSGMAGSRVAVESLRVLNYSEHTLATLDESSLDETAGLSPLAAGYTGLVRFNDPAAAVGAESGPVDWNGNGVIDTAPVSVDLNLQGGATETMKGFTDWPHPTALGATCATSADCPVSGVREAIRVTQDPTVDPNQPCAMGACLSFSYAFQCLPWGERD
jgi:hypothetical protein